MHLFPLWMFYLEIAGRITKIPCWCMLTYVDFCDKFTQCFWQLFWITSSNVEFQRVEFPTVLVLQNRSIVMPIILTKQVFNRCIWRLLFRQQQGIGVWKKLVLCNIMIGNIDSSQLCVRNHAESLVRRVDCPWLQDFVSSLPGQHCHDLVKINVKFQQIQPILCYL